ncbi:MAG: bifunctional demethylmenaquinone methyltransferase/2-methoxy-6-polyprenyl-1,4-benzoquinol methylase UbiE [Sumerlaeia bacterium]
MSELSKDPQRISQMFGEIAPVYDRLNTVFSLNIDALWRKTVAEKAVRSADHVILDLACGSGALTKALMKRANPHATVLGVDFCRPLLYQAQKLLPNATFYQGDGLKLPAQDCSVDLLTIAFGLRNMQDPHEGLLEMHRVLKPGGRLAVLEFTQANNIFLRAMHSVYQNKILPKIGDFVSGTTAYSYLNDSIADWPEAPELARWIRRAGFRDVRYNWLQMRNAALHIGVKS